MKFFSSLTFALLIGAVMLFGSGCGQDGTTEKKQAPVSAPKPPSTPPAVTRAPSGGGVPMPPPGGKPDPAAYTTARQLYAEKNGIPEAYQGLSSTLTDNAVSLKRGEAIFRVRCILCHGHDGSGNGQAAGALKPPPSNLALLVANPIATDPYLFWAITDGGRDVGSAMPSFKTLSENDRWALILFLRERIAHK